MQTDAVVSGVVTIPQYQPHLITRAGEPVEVVIIDGEEIEVADAEQCAAMLRHPMKTKTFRIYSSEGLPKGNPAPKAIATAHPSGRRLYAVRAVLEWDARRPGPGGWGHK
jgi:hypothetical protein